MDKVYCFYDYETRSEANLKKVGAHEYSVHPSTRILCASWRIGTRENIRRQPIQRWSPYLRSTNNKSLRSALDHSGVVMVAHNAAFERMITENVLKVQGLPPSKFICTAALTSFYGLPRKLEHTCEALGLPVQKDMEGHRLMLKMTKPRKATKHNKNKWHNKIKDLLRVMDYCDIDVEADTEVFLALPPLPKFEQALWELDQVINGRGFLCDRDMVAKVLNMISEEKAKLNAETMEITHGLIASTTQREQVARWLKWQGVHLPNLQAKTVSDAIKDGVVEGKEKRMLEIRQAVCKTSNAKYSQFDIRTRHDGRARDGFMYYGAHTGRWTGKGLQPHNFPQGRGLGKDLGASVALACDVVKKGDLELVRLLYGEPMTTFSHLLRPVIIASPGKVLYCGDFAGIELRVLFWVAGHDEGLQTIIEDRDLYREQATDIYRVILEDVTKDQREVGKRAILGAGFGMGDKKFRATCEQYGTPVTEVIAKRAIDSYRKRHWPVPQLWKNLETVAIKAVKFKGQKFSTNKTTWWYENKFLQCRLPSGRILYYYDPTIKYQADQWGNKRPTLYFWHVNATTKKWVQDTTWGGPLAENVVQGTARDFMAYSMPPIEAKGFEILGTVHDEILAEREEGHLKEFEQLMSASPSWGKGMPIKVEASAGRRYHK